MAECVIEVGHPAGTPASWQDRDHPEMTVCDHHKQQYETAYDDYSHLHWVTIEE